MNDAGLLSRLVTHKSQRWPGQGQNSKHGDPDVKADNIRRVLVVGAGIMGAGIAQNFAQADLEVRLLDVNTASLEQCRSRINSNLQAFEEHGLLSESKQMILERISFYTNEQFVEAVVDCDFVVEAMPEIVELKQELFARLDQLPGQIILASNTSSMTISRIAETMSTGSRVIGLHYFNPAHIIPAVEIHTGRDTSEATVGITIDLMERAGKLPVRVRKEVPGFIINRLTGAMEREIDYLLDEGVVSPEDLDRAVKGSYGFRLACLGPMEAEDMIGLDTAARASANIFPTLSNAQEPSPHLLEKVGRGELGIKSGSGWYDYPENTRAEALDRNNHRLLKQLKLFNLNHDGESPN